MGDVVRFKTNMVTTPWDNEEPEAINAGDLYVVVGLVGSGWDLERRSGSGPLKLRILNSEMQKYVVASTNER